jgi:hypothetical protein
VAEILNQMDYWEATVRDSGERKWRRKAEEEEEEGRVVQVNAASQGLASCVQCSARNDILELPACQGPRGKVAAEEH